LACITTGAWIFTEILFRSLQGGRPVCSRAADAAEAGGDAAGAGDQPGGGVQKGRLKKALEIYENLQWFGVE
jgi:hypothetical protein